MKFSRNSCLRPANIWISPVVGPVLRRRGGKSNGNDRSNHNKCPSALEYTGGSDRKSIPTFEGVRACMPGEVVAVVVVVKTCSSYALIDPQKKTHSLAHWQGKRNFTRVSLTGDKPFLWSSSSSPEYHTTLHIAPTECSLTHLLETFIALEKTKETTLDPPSSSTSTTNPSSSCPFPFVFLYCSLIISTLLPIMSIKRDPAD